MEGAVEPHDADASTVVVAQVAFCNAPRRAEGPVEVRVDHSTLYLFPKEEGRRGGHDPYDGSMAGTRYRSSGVKGPAEFRLGKRFPRPPHVPSSFVTAVVGDGVRVCHTYRRDEKDYFVFEHWGGNLNSVLFVKQWRG
jgi:hypothetical protein